MQFLLLKLYTERENSEIKFAQNAWNNLSQLIGQLKHKQGWKLTLARSPEASEIPSGRVGRPTWPARWASGNFTRIYRPSDRQPTTDFKYITLQKWNPESRPFILASFSVNYSVT